MTTPNISRNDPCTCGSGRKFKRCCGAAGALALEPPMSQAPASLDFAPTYDERARSDACDRLFGFGMRPDFAAHRDRCYSRLWGPYADRMRDPHHVLRQRLPMISASEIHHALVDSALPSGRTILQTLLEQRGAVLPAGERRFLTELSRSCVSLYEIVHVEAGRGFELLDLWRSQRVWVLERLASQQLDRWDLIAARLLVRPDGGLGIDSDLWPFHPPSKSVLIAALEREHAALRRVRGDVPADVFLKSSSHVYAQVHARGHFEPEDPKLATFDGQLLEPTSMLFEVRDLRALRRQLAGCRDLDPNGAGGFVWGKTQGEVNYGLGWVELPTPDRTLLLATAMARVHAGELRAVLERAGGGLITFRSERTFTLAEWREQGGALRAPTPPTAVSSLAGSTPLAQSRMNASLAHAAEAQHYRNWLDTPLPLLDGRTPRAAASDESLRPRVLELLKSIENSQQQRTRFGGHSPVDVTFVWRELGLEPPAPPPKIVPTRVPVVDLLDWTLRHATTIVGGRQGARFERYSTIVRAAEGAPHGAEIMIDLACSRRPGRAKCVGRIHVLVADETLLRWRCGACGDAEQLMGWGGLLNALNANERNVPAPERPARQVAPENPWPELFQAVVGFRDLASWRWMNDEDLFGVEDPATGEIGWCCVLGAAGELEGLAVYLGDRGFDRWQRVQAENFRPDEGLFGQDALVLAFGNRASLWPEEHKRLRALGVACRGERAWPSIESHRYGRLPRTLDDVEATRLAHTIDQALTVAVRAGDGERLLGPDANGRFFVRRLSRTGGTNARWFDERIEPPKAIVRSAPALDSVAVERLRRSIPGTQGVWEVDIVPVMAPVEEPGCEPYMPASFLAIERGSELILHVDMRPPSDLSAQAQDGLLEAVRVRGKRPHTVCVRRPWVADGLARVADALGIRVEVCVELELLASTVAHMSASLERGPPGATRKSPRRRP